MTSAIESGAASSEDVSAGSKVNVTLPATVFCGGGGLGEVSDVKSVAVKSNVLVRGMACEADEETRATAMAQSALVIRVSNPRIMATLPLRSFDPWNGIP